ncbi:MAG: hypothetical protein ACNS64_03935 [Candidatus Halalkalibacterium sp. M3_1C_030]
MFKHSDKADDAIEELFRKKVQEYEIDYREEDWLKLNKRLDLLDQQKSLLEKILDAFRN